MNPQSLSFPVLLSRRCTLVHYLTFLIFFFYCPSRVLRSSSSTFIQVSRNSLVFRSWSFRTAAPTIWNSLPNSFRSSGTFHFFRRHFKTHLHQAAFNTLLAAYYSASDSLVWLMALYKWFYLLTYYLLIHLFTYLLTYLHTGWLRDRKNFICKRKKLILFYIVILFYVVLCYMFNYLLACTKSWKQGDRLFIYLLNTSR